MFNKMKHRLVQCSSSGILSPISLMFESLSLCESSRVLIFYRWLMNIKEIIDAVDERLQLSDSVNEKDDVITPLKGIYRVQDSVKTHFDSNDERSYIKFISGFVS